MEHFYQYSLVAHHLGEEQAVNVQQRINVAAILKVISQERSWYPKVTEVLEAAWTAKYQMCPSFKQALDNLSFHQIVYDNPDMFLGCGMTYAVAILTDSAQYPGRNLVGNSLSRIKQQYQDNRGIVYMT